MKLSDLTTDQALDVLCELTPHVSKIVADETVVGTVGKAINTEQPLNTIGKFMLITERIGELLPLLLKTHRPDVYGILSVMNGKTAKEIAAQPLMDTMRQTGELFQDEELLVFFKSFARQDQTVLSAPSAPSPDSE